MATQPPPRRRPQGGDAPAVPAATPRRTGARPSAPSAAAAKLICTAGPKAGNEFPLSEDEVVVGRATDATVSIPDTSVSRRHVAFRRAGAGWTVSDLGSGNGTLVNGAPVEGEVALASGDVITLGDTELQFENGGDSTDRGVGQPARPRPTRSRPSMSGARGTSARLSRPGIAEPDPAAEKKKKLIMVGIAAVVVLAVGGIAGAKVLQGKAAEAQALQDQQTREQRAQLAAQFQEAKTLVRNGDWNGAKVILDQLAALNPPYPGVQTYVDRAAKEVPNQANLSAAETALKAGKLSEASEALAKVTSDTAMFEQRQKLREMLDSKVAPKLSEGRALLGQANFDGATAIVDDVLKMSPENKAALDLQKDIKQAIADKNRPPPPPDPTKKPKLWEPAVARFREGDSTGALGLADECAAKKDAKCREIAKDMREFMALFKRVEELDGAKLERLLSLDRQITPGDPSVMAKKAGTRAATAFYRSAANAKTSQQWPKATQYARKCLQADPGNSGCQAIVSEMKSKAKETYLAGYTIKDTQPDDACQHFRAAAAMAPPDDETHDKAQRQAEKYCH